MVGVVDIVREISVVVDVVEIIGVFGVVGIVAVVDPEAYNPPDVPDAPCVSSEVFRLPELVGIGISKFFRNGVTNTSYQLESEQLHSIDICNVDMNLLHLCRDRRFESKSGSLETSRSYPGTYTALDQAAHRTIRTEACTHRSVALVEYNHLHGLRQSGHCYDGRRDCRLRSRSHSRRRIRRRMRLDCVHDRYLRGGLALHDGHEPHCSHDLDHN